ncbi:hypothetical protein DZS_20660 [Dickeya ananatis]
MFSLFRAVKDRNLKLCNLMYIVFHEIISGIKIRHWSIKYKVKNKKGDLERTAQWKHSLMETFINGNIQ